MIETTPRRSLRLAVALVAAVPAMALAGDWAAWRGPNQNGVSGETGLVESWSPAGDHVIWRQAFTGRSAPVVFDGRACAIGRVGEALDKQEVVACFDAGDGHKLWERRFGVFQTAVPFSRVGWANPTADPETGNLYVQTVAGELAALDRKGAIVWSHSLTEEYGRISGYGGRTHSPIVDEDRVVISFSNVGWGETAAPRHRTYAFDKRTGALLWVATPGGAPLTITTQSVPTIAVIKGQRLLIEGNGDGWIYALKARTGEKVWGFQLSKQGLNTSVVVEGDRVYATSADENLDKAVMGRIVCIDGTGTGDITKTNEVWRVDELQVGFSSPLLHGGTLYVIDDSANLFALEAATGRNLWQQNLGTVGKASPVWADGKIFAVEVNGNVHIIRPEADKAVVLDSDHVTMPGGHYAEIYGSPAIAYGRLYFVSEEGLYCIGDGKQPFKATPGPAIVLPEDGPAQGAAASVALVPAEVIAKAGEKITFKARAFDFAGRALGEVDGTWSLEGLAGTVEGGIFTTDPKAKGPQAGKVAFTFGALKAAARARVFPDLPWKQDFDAIEVGKAPAGWIGAGNRFTVQEKDGTRVLAKPFMDQGLERQSVFIGSPLLADYTVQADVMGSAKGHKRPDVGVIAGRYTLDLMGKHDKLQLRDWAELRAVQNVEFPLQPDVWYTVKLRVEPQGDRALVRGKVWPRGGKEPEDWTITLEDPVPNRSGSPGLYGYSAADIFYDNLTVTRNER